MFCFCFQSPSLKLQALEADTGPLPQPADPQAQDNLPAQNQPLSSEEQDPFLPHNLLLHSSPTAQDQQTVDLLQPGKIVLIFQNDNIQLSLLLMLNICLGQRGN